MERPRVLLADDHRAVIQGIREMLAAEFEVVGAVNDGRSLVDAAESLDPDVIVADISMPELDGIEAARLLMSRNPNAKIVFLTVHEEHSFITEALRTGARAYVLKRSAPVDLPRAIREALSGGTYLSPELGLDLPLDLNPHQEG